MAIRRGLSEERGTLHAAECSLGRRVRKVAPLVSTRISPESVNLGGKNNNEKEGCRDNGVDDGGVQTTLLFTGWGRGLSSKVEGPSSPLSTLRALEEVLWGRGLSVSLLIFYF